MGISGELWERGKCGDYRKTGEWRGM